MMTGNEGRINNENKEGKIRWIKNRKGEDKKKQGMTTEWKVNE